MSSQHFTMAGNIPCTGAGLAAPVKSAIKFPGLVTGNVIRFSRSIFASHALPSFSVQTYPPNIIAAFPALTISPAEIDGIPPESGCYKRDMGGKHWAEVSEEVYESHTDAFILMAPDTLKHFIAGYLSVAFNTTNSLTSESLIYAATQGDHLSKLCNVLTLPQVRCLFDVIEHVYLDNYGDSDDKEFSVIRKRRSEMLALHENNG